MAMVGFGSPPPSGGFGVSVSGNGLVNGSGSSLVLHGVNVTGPQNLPAQQSRIWEVGFQTNLSTMWPIANCIRVPVNAYAWLDGAVPPPTSTVPSGQTSGSYLAAAQAAPPSPYVANPGFYPNPPGQSSFHHLPNGSTVTNFATCFGATYRTAIINFINQCAATSRYVILDLHWTDPFVQPGWTTSSASMGGGGQCNMPDYFSQCFWDHAAYTFAQSPWVIFEMVNEPWGSNVGSAATATVVQQSFGPGAGEWGMYANGGLCLMVPTRGSWNSQNVNVTSGTGYNTAAGSGGQVNITGVSVAAGTATVTCGANHGLVTGQPTMIIGCTTTGFNGIATVTGVPSLTQFQVATGLGSVTPGSAAWSVACFQSVGFQTILNTIRSSGARNVVIMPGLKAEGEPTGITHVAYGLPITDLAHQLALGIHYYSDPNGGLAAATTADTNGNYPLIGSELNSEDTAGAFEPFCGLPYPVPATNSGLQNKWVQFVENNRTNASSIWWAFSLALNAAGGAQALITSQATGNPTSGFPGWAVTNVTGNTFTVPQASGYLSVGDSVSAWVGPNPSGGGAFHYLAVDTVQSISGSGNSYQVTLTNSGSQSYTGATYLGTAEAQANNGGFTGWGCEQWMKDTYGH